MTDIAALLRDAAKHIRHGTFTAELVAEMDAAAAELESAEPVPNDARTLADIGNELHNLSCEVNSTREDWADQLGSIAGELWRWESHPPSAVPDCPYPCGWKNLHAIAVKKAAYFARATLDDDFPGAVRDAGIELGKYAVEFSRVMRSAAPQGGGE